MTELILLLLTMFGIINPLLYEVVTKRRKYCFRVKPVRGFRKQSYSHLAFMPRSSFGSLVLPPFYMRAVDFTGIIRSRRRIGNFGGRTAEGSCSWCWWRPNRSCLQPRMITPTRDMGEGGLCCEPTRRFAGPKPCLHGNMTDIPCFVLVAAPSFLVAGAPWFGRQKYKNGTYFLLWQLS